MRSARKVRRFEAQCFRLDLSNLLLHEYVAVQNALTVKTSGSLKLQMAEFMSGEHSIPLSDFIYQLQYFVFKAKNPDPETKWYQLRRIAHIVPWIRMNLHELLSQGCVRDCWPSASLHIPYRTHYTQLEEARANNYLLHKYSDFIDRRGGSVPGQEYNSGGVLLDKRTMLILTQERDDAEQTEAEEEEQRMEQMGVLIGQKLKDSKKEDGNQMDVNIKLKDSKKKVESLKAVLERKDKEKAGLVRS